MLNKTIPLTALLLSAALAVAPAPLSAQGGDTVRKDLKAVLALKGKPCGEIVDLERQGENDYLVTCNDGHRYRIFIDAQDRVIVEERK